MSLLLAIWTADPLVDPCHQGSGRGGALLFLGRGLGFLAAAAAAGSLVAHVLPSLSLLRDESDRNLWDVRGATPDDDITVDCTPAGGGWACRVRVGRDANATEHHVSVSSAELARFAPHHDEPTRLVEASFGYLLERESREAILRRFHLSDIERYFPAYPREIAGRI